MVKTRRLGAALFFAAVYATQAGHNSCSGDLLHDSGFDLWCGDQLCSWQLEKGELRQVPTWHEADLGVELVGDQVVISQLTDASNTPCVLFDLVADIDADASVELEMDLYDDGEVDFTERLPTASWDSLSYLVRMPERFQGIRFRLKKSGGGHAVLAQIRAREEQECGGAPLAQPVSPLGAGCWGVDGENLVLEDAWCASGSCAMSRPGEGLSPAVCSQCADDADCGEEVCGVEASVRSFLTPYRACVAAASRGLGELCMEDDECATGVCCTGVCSDCCSQDDRSCDDGGACAPAPSPGGRHVPPEQCDPGGRTRASGAACLIDEDCSSGRCSGGDPLTICLADGRLCDLDADCPDDGTQEEGEFGTCSEIGVTRGICD